MRSLFTLIALAFLAAPAHAYLAFWRGDEGDIMVDSSGVALDGSYKFEVGQFVSGFAPTVHNLDQWATNWVIFDRAEQAGFDGWYPSIQEVNTAANYTNTFNSDSDDANPSSTFAQGSQLYLWVYNDLSITPGSEWLLATDDPLSTHAFRNWELPGAVDMNGSGTWHTQDLSIPFFGSINGVTGPGEYSSTPNSFRLQTAAVPEPSALLLSLAALPLFLRRRRS
jgi:hypothetical protein